MKNSIHISNFKFSPSGYGHYIVTYISPTTWKEFSCTTNDMPLIDSTKNCECPKQVDLVKLKRICKTR